MVSYTTWCTETRLVLLRFLGFFFITGAQRRLSLCNIARAFTERIHKTMDVDEFPDQASNGQLRIYLTLCLPVSSAGNFANSLDPDQARQNVGHDLGPKLFDTLMVFL